MNIKEAAEIREKLARAFDDVVIHGAQNPIFITAKGHNRLLASHVRKCSHTRIRKSRNVFAGLRFVGASGNKVMCKADDDHQGLRFKEIVECADCEVVLEATIL